MVSGFVSGGTIEAPIERDAEWIQAQKDIEDARRKKEEIARQHDGKTLYEVLQSNKGMPHLRIIVSNHIAWILLL